MKTVVTQRVGLATPQFWIRIIFTQFPKRLNCIQPPQRQLPGSENSRSDFYSIRVMSTGIGNRNERGEGLIEFCQNNNLIITNTWFQHYPRKIYTWKSPGDIARSQIDYIMINKRFRNNVKQAKAYPGADMNSNHNLVAIKWKAKLKQMKKSEKREQINLDLLRQDNFKIGYNIEVRNQYELLNQEECDQMPVDQTDKIGTKWANIKHRCKWQ